MKTYYSHDALFYDQLYMELNMLASKLRNSIAWTDLYFWDLTWE